MQRELGRHGDGASNKTKRWPEYSNEQMERSEQTQIFVCCFLRTQNVKDFFTDFVGTKGPKNHIRVYCGVVGWVQTSE